MNRDAGAFDIQLEALIGSAAMRRARANRRGARR